MDVEKPANGLSELTDVLERLLPCPFCGKGNFDLAYNGRIWAGTHWGTPASISVRHWCPHIDGQPGPVMIERKGRDLESAVAAWNMRSNAELKPQAGQFPPVAL